ncbi:MAG: hypothetical protein RLZZ165_1513 [Bacteroidota bacterium]|jgi:phenylacetate-coenzyme A ligase PaaK-like adenylate-forming protein
MARPPDIARLFAPRFGSEEFGAFSDELWQYQLQENPVIRRYCTLLGDDRMQFLPIRFFKDFEMRCGADWNPETVFQSSGTTGQERSRHLVRDLRLYESVLMHGFRHFYGEEGWTVFALLPNYLDQGHSSLVYMVRAWILDFGLPGSGFYLQNFDALRQGLAAATAARERILLIGVSFALLDFAATHSVRLPADAIVMETGGMKGRREELTRAELHGRLRAAFGVDRIHSEYGMTELMSQAFSIGEERFRCPPWMRVVITDPYRPMKQLDHGRPGRLNLIDLANVHSCAFISTDDMGIRYEDGSFEMLGRLEHAESRGCNLMYL